MSGDHLAIGSGRPVAAEVRRLATELSDEAVARLHATAEEPRETAVHEARKRLKELRALLRLIERAAGRRQTKEWRRELRDGGRLLSGARDADVLHETFGKLQERFGDAFLRSRAFTAELIASADSIAADTGPALQLVVSFDDAAALWRFEVAPKDIASAIRTSIRRVRRAMKTALEERSAGAFHEWRKRAKDLWYQARITANVMPGMRDREPQLRRLARILGDHHDLVILREVAAAHAEASNAAEAINVVVLARERMRELELETEVLGHETLDPEFDLTLRNDWAMYQAFALA